MGSLDHIADGILSVVTCAMHTVMKMFILHFLAQGNTLHICFLIVLNTNDWVEWPNLVKNIHTYIFVDSITWTNMLIGNHASI